MTRIKRALLRHSFILLTVKGWVMWGYDVRTNAYQKKENYLDFQFFLRLIFCDICH